MDLWQWRCRNRREKKLLQLVCGNAIAEIEGKKNVRMNLWQWHCRNRKGKKKESQLICGNGIVEIGGKKNCCNWFVAMVLPK